MARRMRRRKQREGANRRPDRIDRGARCACERHLTCDGSFSCWDVIV